MFFYSEIAITMENIKANKDELSKGIGNKTVCLNKYVEAGFASPEAFRAANSDYKAIAKERTHWEKQEIGDKVRMLRDEFGDGILLAIPSTMTAATFLTWSVGKTSLLIHALKSAPWVSAFQAILDANTGWMMQILRGEKPASQIRKDRATAVHGKVILEVMSEADNQSIQKSLRQTVNMFPTEGTITACPQLGCLAASPTKNDMESLLSGQDISDDIIRAILGLHLAAMPEPRNVQVIDPSYC